MSDLNSREAYLLNRESVINNVFKELLVFRSLYDAENSVKNQSGEIIEKLYWVKAIKDYPYIEIVHGKPELASKTINNPVFIAKGQNYLITPVISKQIKFGERVKIPKITISDTGHVVNVQSDDHILPGINTEYPLTQEPQPNSNIIILKHSPIGTTPPDGYAEQTTLITPQKPNFGTDISVAAPKYDNYGHFKASVNQQINFPDVLVGSELTKQITPASVGARRAFITLNHKNSYEIINPALEELHTEGSLRPTELKLNNPYILSVGKNNEFGHINEKKEIPFLVRHPIYLGGDGGYVASKITSPTSNNRIINPNDNVNEGRQNQNRIGVVIGALDTLYTINADGSFFCSYYITSTQAVDIIGGDIRLTIFKPAGSAVNLRVDNTSNWIENGYQGEPLRWAIRSGTLPANNPQRLFDISGTVSSFPENSSFVVSCSYTQSIYQTSDTTFTNKADATTYQTWESGQLLRLPCFWLSKEGHVTGYDYQEVQLDPLIGARNHSFYQELQNISAADGRTQDYIKFDTLSELMGQPDNQFRNGIDYKTGLPIYATATGPNEGKATLYGLLGLPICKPNTIDSTARNRYATIVMVYDALRDLQMQLQTTNMAVNGLIRQSTDASSPNAYLNTNGVLDSAPDVSKIPLLIEPGAAILPQDSKVFNDANIAINSAEARLNHSGYINSNNEEVSLQVAYDELKTKYDTLINVLPELIEVFTTYSAGTGRIYDDINSSDLRVKEAAQMAYNKIEAIKASVSVNLTKTTNSGGN